MTFGRFKVNFWSSFHSQTISSPPSFLSQVFQTTFIFSSGFKFALVLALTHKFFRHNLLFAVIKWLLDSLASVL